MTPEEFLRTIYLGDRACKAIVVDGWNATVRLQVDCISRVRSESGAWDFYAEEDIADGQLVFTGVGLFEMKNDGYLPNDSINDIVVVEEDENGTTFEISIDAVGSDAGHHETILRVRCTALHLEDPADPGIPITE